MSSDSGLRRTLRCLKLSGHRTALRYRQRSELPVFVKAQSVPKLLLDTTVYIDELQGKLPPDVARMIDAASLWHSTVTECELSALAGLLNPNHPDTPHTINQVLASIERRPNHRIVNPDREVWRDAGILAGLLARVQQYGKAEQRQALNDALIFLSAEKAGLTVLTRNLSDFDLLMQLAPYGKVLFYDI
ncbi:type II toxin-antitoxin system VapC family toxin [Granulicella mallensis]|uniref:PIN domain-containing protein n=1 Tax=Granulicella mallensis (strain ATCC BAA-1857 / DSM 23137 / MP5ACTX8) TaxID=682795 RepID=G8NYU8_GRAMM|nr:type II toxin-antitoxin system VapC family toxin [Granulicella mallensis]AEU34511.1 hypothetical protein AciX8_0153 [Granulicella mallensis MP5ACTX8]